MGNRRMIILISHILVLNGKEQLLLSTIVKFLRMSDDDVVVLEMVD